MPVTIVRNKVDLSGEAVEIKEENGTTTVCLSAQTHQGVDLLREHLKTGDGFPNRDGRRLLSTSPSS